MTEKLRSKDIEDKIISVGGVPLIQKSDNELPSLSTDWYKLLFLRDYGDLGKRFIDTCSYFDIITMYQQQYLCCDDCGAYLGEEAMQRDFTQTPIIDHILHIINTQIVWGCHNCHISDVKAGRIIIIDEETRQHCEDILGDNK